MLMASGTLSGFDLQRAVLAVEGLSAPEKTVLLVLAVMANESAQAWPGINSLMAKCSLSERSVQRAVQSLKSMGHIKREEKLGHGVVYTVTPVTVAPLPDSHPRHDDTPATQAPTPVTVAPKQPVTTNTSEPKGSSVVVKRAARLPEDWQPAKPYPPKVQALTDQWPPGREERELDGFRDYWATRQRDAAKLNWDKAWHNRIRDQHDRIIREARYANRPSNDRTDEIQNVRLRAAVNISAERDRGRRYAGF